jgi:hypothetical protein
MTQLVPTDADRKAAEQSLEVARIKAAAVLPQLLEIMVDKAIDPMATAKNVMDAAEFTYKVSGLAKRQEESKAGPSFVVKITLPGQNREVVIGGGLAKQESDSEFGLLDSLPTLPEHVTAMLQPSDDLDSDAE